MKKLVRILLGIWLLNIIMLISVLIVKMIIYGGEAKTPMWFDLWGYTWIFSIFGIAFIALIAWRKYVWEGIKEFIDGR